MNRLGATFVTLLWALAAGPMAAEAQTLDWGAGTTFEGRSPGLSGWGVELGAHKDLAALSWGGFGGVLQTNSVFVGYGGVQGGPKAAGGLTFWGRAGLAGVTRNDAGGSASFLGLGIDLGPGSNLVLRVRGDWYRDWAGSPTWGPTGTWVWTLGIAWRWPS